MIQNTVLFLADAFCWYSQNRSILKYERTVWKSTLEATESWKWVRKLQLLEIFYYSKIITKDGSQKRRLSPNTNVFKRKINKLFTAARKSTKDGSKMYVRTK